MSSRSTVALRPVTHRRLSTGIRLAGAVAGVTAAGWAAPANATQTLESIWLQVGGAPQVVMNKSDLGQTRTISFVQSSQHPPGTKLPQGTVVASCAQPVNGLLGGTVNNPTAPGFKLTLTIPGSGQIVVAGQQQGLTPFQQGVTLANGTTHAIDVKFGSIHAQGALPKTYSFQLTCTPLINTGVLNSGIGQIAAPGATASGNLSPGSVQLPAPGQQPQVSPPDLDVTQVRVTFPQLNYGFDAIKFAHPSSLTSVHLRTRTSKPVGTPLGKNAQGIPVFAADSCAAPLTTVVTATVRNAGGAAFDVPKPLPDGNTVQFRVNGMGGSNPSGERFGMSPLPAQQSKSVSHTSMRQPDGTQAISVMLNPGGAGGETNDSNNLWQGQFSVSCDAN